MKLNSTASMIPLTMPGFSNMHPFAPVEQTKGYQQLIKVGLPFFFSFDPTASPTSHPPS